MVSPIAEYSTLEKPDFLGLLPCPLKVPIEELLNTFMRERMEKKGDVSLCLIESNANKHTDFFAWIDQCERIDDFPYIMMASGFSHFLYRDFREKFIDKGLFTSVGNPVEGNPAISPDLSVLDLIDPDGHYNIPCFNPMVMLVDRTNYPDLPTPRRWQDLLEPEYEGLVALRGHHDRNFCEGALLNVYRDLGEEGVRRLGKATRCGLHPSQMVRLAGSGKAESPAVSAIPYSFARLVRPASQVSIIWPEDGAIVNPSIMLVKTGCPTQVREIAEFMTGKEVGRIFADASFPSSNPQVDNHLPPEARFKWLGWDFLRENDLGKLAPRIDEIFLGSYLEGKR